MITAESKHDDQGNYIKTRGEERGGDIGAVKDTKKSTNLTWKAT